MRRTQLYLDEEMARLLAAESRRRRTTVSALVREAVARSYDRGTEEDRRVIIDRLAGVWRDRDDMTSAEFVRRLRRSTRRGRWTRGVGGKVPPRHRCHH